MLDRRTGVVVLALLLGAGAVGVAAGAVVGGRRDLPVGTAALNGTLTPTPDPQPSAGPSDTFRPAPQIPAPLPTRPATIPVYVLGDTDAGPRLYREFRRGEGEPVALAVAGLATAPEDPDYRSPWLGDPGRVTRSGTAATVTFGQAPALGARDTEAAVQQVVYTVTAADPKITAVRVVAPGLPAAMTAAPVRRADQLDTLAPVWLLDPVDGASASGKLTVSGTASVFEATVNIEVRRDSAVMARTTATASVGAPGRGDWRTTLSVPPGDYVVAAYEVSEKDGSRVGVDTKRVTVTGR